MASIIPQLIPVFLQQTDAISNDLNDMLARQDWRGIQLKAHSLKGSSAQLLLKELKDAAAAVEQQAQSLTQKQPDASQIPDTTNALQISNTVLHLKQVLEASRHRLREAIL
jgi:HPt (histidine-containing phosphotransfer) domain-containing protein